MIAMTMWEGSGPPQLILNFPPATNALLFGGRSDAGAVRTVVGTVENRDRPLAGVCDAYPRRIVVQVESIGADGGRRGAALLCRIGLTRGARVVCARLTAIHTSWRGHTADTAHAVKCDPGARVPHAADLELNAPGASTCCARARSATHCSRFVVAGLPAPTNAAPTQSDIRTNLELSKVNQSCPLSQAQYRGGSPERFGWQVPCATMQAHAAAAPQGFCIAHTKWPGPGPPA
jgi:hypothetical protein